jgi:hypothetical protein
MFDLPSIVRAISDWLTNERRSEAAESPADPLVANRARAVERARRIATKPSVYVLGAGGRDPKADVPFTKRDGKYGSDCVGFTCWCLGHDRYQPATFTAYTGWINTDSLMMDARGSQQWYAAIKRPGPGDVVVFPSIVKDGHRKRMGHIALVVSVPHDMPADVYALSDTERRSWLLRVGVIDCAAALMRKPYAVHETTAAASWDKPDAMFARCVRAPG